MPLTWRENTLYMDWCLECHRAPERYVRPRQYVFSMDYQPPVDQIALGREAGQGIQDSKVDELLDLSSMNGAHE